MPANPKFSSLLHGSEPNCTLCEDQTKAAQGGQRHRGCPQGTGTRDTPKCHVKDMQDSSMLTPGWLLLIRHGVLKVARSSQLGSDAAFETKNIES